MIFPKTPHIFMISGMRSFSFSWNEVQISKFHYFILFENSFITKTYFWISWWTITLNNNKNWVKNFSEIKKRKKLLRFYSKTSSKTNLRYCRSLLFINLKWHANWRRFDVFSVIFKNILRLLLVFLLCWLLICNCSPGNRSWTIFHKRRQTITFDEENSEAFNLYFCELKNCHWYQ